MLSVEKQNCKLSGKKAVTPSINFLEAKDNNDNVFDWTLDGEGYYGEADREDELEEEDHASYEEEGIEEEEQDELDRSEEGNYSCTALPKIHSTYALLQKLLHQSRLLQRKKRL